MDERVDVCVVGAGAAGLMSAIWAGRKAPAGSRIVALDGARTLGAKILVAGGGRCNVTHDVVAPREYAGSTTPSIRKVLRRFDVPETVAFFESLGVTLKREETGKLFPTTDKARTVLNALLGAVRKAGAEVRFPWRAGSVRTDGGVFHVERDDGGASIVADRVILAAGGKSLPKSGSDGAGYALVRALGHSVTERVFPALVPLVIGPDDPAGLKALSGVSQVAELRVVASSGKRLHVLTGSTLCTHFGLSGPGPMDISRYLTNARMDDSGASLEIGWLAGVTPEQADAELLALGQGTCARWLREHAGGGVPGRLADAICALAGVDGSTPGHALRKEQRRGLARAATAMRVSISGDRGWNAAEVTAGGVPLSELDLKTMESRVCPGLFLCGELCDVDGRIGGYNFQWAWASGFVAGSSAGGVSNAS